MTPEPVTEDRADDITEDRLAAAVPGTEATARILYSRLWVHFQRAPVFLC